jgi:hypothetical protein
MMLTEFILLGFGGQQRMVGGGNDGGGGSITGHERASNSRRDANAALHGKPGWFLGIDQSCGFSGGHIILVSDA